MEILTSDQMRLADNMTISQKSIDSIELMETAALACVNEILDKFNNTFNFYIFCGPGNNGGDGLAIARLLSEKNYQVKVFLINTGEKLSRDNHLNLQKALANGLEIEELKIAPDIETFAEKSVIVDALFGTGLNQKVDGEYAKLIKIINQSGRYVLSIDMPSGLFADRSSISDNPCIVKASATYTFQYLKLALLMPENASFCGDVKVLNIGLIPESTENMNIINFMLDEKLIKSLIRIRPPFSHKGTYGHGLLIAGGKGKLGACIMSAGAFLRSGAGLLTVMITEDCFGIIHSALPEAMAVGTSFKNLHPDKYSVAGIGPGFGTDPKSVKNLDDFLNNWTNPVVFDADALNIMSENKSWLKRIPPGSVLTPHPGEFKRMFGDWNDDFEKIEKLRKQSSQLNCIIVLKGKYTAIAFPDGRIYFNPTGNPGMSKGGSGDVLTGLISGLMTSGYDAESAACLGVYLHGLAGDFASADKSEQGMTAVDIIKSIPDAWKAVLKY